MLLVLGRLAHLHVTASMWPGAGLRVLSTERDRGPQHTEREALGKAFHSIKCGVRGGDLKASKVTLADDY